MTRLPVSSLSAVLLATTAPAADPPPAITEAIRSIRSVSREGAGSEAASAAWKKLVAAGPDALIPVLTALDQADPTAANWLRTSVDGIVEAARRRKQPLPVADLIAFVKDPERSAAGRRIAFELYSAEAKDEAARLLPTLIDDPSVEIRRDAIAARIEKLPADPAALKAELRTLFEAARDQDQVEALAKKIEAAGEAKPDLTTHFGFVTEWHVALPFDGPNASGFATAYPPESGVDLAARYPGKDGSEVTWKYVQSAVPFAQIDLNKELGKHKDAVAYAYAVVEVEKETPAEVRVSTANAIQVFLNGKKVFEREEYHHGAPFDQYVAKGVLKPGRNEVLLKLCQNDQKDDWAQAWFFSARICDPTGGKLPLTQVVSRGGKPVKTALGVLKPEDKKEEKK